MDVLTSRTLILSNLPIIFVAGIACYLASIYRKNGLNRYPGPLLAKFTNLWYLLDVRTNLHCFHIAELHKKYGDVVRIGPNTLSIANLDYIPRIYGTKDEFLKTDAYAAFAPRVNGKAIPWWISILDREQFGVMKKPVVGFYTPAAVIKYEPLVDDMLKKFVDRLKGEINGETSKNLDIAPWVRYFAGDVIANITFGDGLGFLDAGKDIDNFLSHLDENNDEIALYFTMPWSAQIFKYNRIAEYFAKDNRFYLNWSLKQLQKRFGSISEKQGTPDTKQTKDLLDHFLTAAQIPGSSPMNYNMDNIMNWTTSAIIPGSETVAIVLRTLIYYLLKNRSKYDKLYEELRSAELSYPVTWKESQQLPYLDACVKEALRIHPIVGQGLERAVPESGLVMPDSYVLPKDTRVCINPWTVSQSSIYGENLEQFIPERWLQRTHETDLEYKDRIVKTRRADFAFGGGRHQCPGRNLALLEIYKCISTLILSFDMGLVDPAEEWHLIDRFVVRQENIRCWLKTRV